MQQLISQASKIYAHNFPSTTWYGRCIFLSWYCDVGTCQFCFRSTQKHKIRYAQNAKRTLSSVLVEALLCKKLGWRIEFLTGGYGIFPLSELVEMARLVSQVYGEKIWLNLGALKKKELKQFQPYVKGIVGSIETVEPKLHQQVCPDKPLAPYEKMFRDAEEFGLKKSMTIVIGLGEKKEDFKILEKFIEKYKLDRITFYALKPVKGTEFENSSGPKTEDYLWWIAQTRIKFPQLEIIAGTTARRYEEVGLLLQAGANAFTKFPATKMFGTPQAKKIEEEIKKAERKLKGSLTKLPKKINWKKEVLELKLEKELEKDVLEKLGWYLERMKENKKNIPQQKKSYNSSGFTDSEPE